MTVEHAAKKPWVEIRRKVGSGAYVTYATVYRKPLCVWVLGRWIIGGRHVRSAWAAVRAAGEPTDQ